MKSLQAFLVLTSAVLITAACSGSSDTESTSAGPPESTANPSEMVDQQAPPERLLIDVTIKAGQVEPVNEQLQAALKQPIIIRVDSDVGDELHVHSNPEHAFKVEARPAQSFQFTVDVPGKVDVELHDLKKTIASISVR